MTDSIQTIERAAPAALAPQSELGAIISMIERLALDPSVDLSRVRALWDFKKEVQEDLDRRAFNAAMAQCQEEMPQAVRNAKNSETHSTYATRDAIGRVVDRVIAKHGFTRVFHPIKAEQPDHVRLECIVAHRGGFERRFEAELPLDVAGAKGGVNKTKIHGWGSATTYLCRYLDALIFNIKTRDDDGNAAGGTEPVSDEQAATLTERISGGGIDLARFLAFFKVETVADLPAKRFKEAIAQIDAAIEYRAKERAKKMAEGASIS